MFESAKVKAGATKRIQYVAWADDGSLVTGLTPTIRILCEGGANAGKFLNDGSPDTWEATPAADLELTELDATNMPGQYYIDWTIPATAGIGYSLRVDGGATVANRYQHGRIEAIAVAESDIPILSTAIDGTTTLQKALQVLMAALAGKASVSGSTVTFKALDGTGSTSRLAVTYGTADGQRTAATIDPA